MRKGLSRFHCNTLKKDSKSRRGGKAVVAVGIDDLRDDPIVEALLEIRFETGELPEVIVGRISDLPMWRTGKKNRLPAADLPAAMRASDAMLRYQPTVEIREAIGVSVVRVGGEVLTVHFLKPYAGWDVIQRSIGLAIDQLFQAVPDVTVIRLGLRYINALTEQRHFVASISDLACSISAEGNPVKAHLHLKYSSDPGPDHTIMTQIVTKPLFGTFVPDATVALDLDVFTKPDFRARDSQSVKQWVDSAHNFEKSAFQRLLGKNLFARLRKESHATAH